MRSLHGRRGEILRFLLAGLANTAFGYAVYLALLPRMHYQLAYAVAYALGIVTQYVLHSRIVYRVPMHWRGLFGYPVIHLILFALAALTLHLAIDVAGIAREWGLLAVYLVTIPATYVLTRIWQLGPRPGPD